MKNVIILDCGPSLTDVVKYHGQAPEWIMEILKDSDCSFKWVKSHEGETVSSDEGDAWIITGSPRSVCDEDDWMLNLEDSVQFAREQQKPVLGICFGHQLIAKSFGGTVELNPLGWELGAYPIQLTDAGIDSPLFAGIDNQSIVYESHQDAVTSLPKNAVELAFNEKGNQAFMLNNNIYSVQFHPEFSWQVIQRYVNVRGAAGVPVDNPEVPKSKNRIIMLHNFINLI